MIKTGNGKQETEDRRPETENRGTEEGECVMGNGESEKLGTGGWRLENEDQ